MRCHIQKTSMNSIPYVKQSLHNDTNFHTVCKIPRLKRIESRYRVFKTILSMKLPENSSITPMNLTYNAVFSRFLSNNHVKINTLYFMDHNRIFPHFHVCLFANKNRKHKHLATVFWILPDEKRVIDQRINSRYRTAVT